MNDDRASAGDVRAELRDRLRDAMRGRDRPAMDVLRAALGAIDNAGAVHDDDRTQTERLNAAADAVDVPRRDVSEDEVRAIVSAELRDLEQAAIQYRELGQQDAAAKADHQASILFGVLGETD